jgi:hypothetical protein
LPVALVVRAVAQALTRMESSCVPVLAAGKTHVTTVVLVRPMSRRLDVIVNRFASLSDRLPMGFLWESRRQDALCSTTQTWNRKNDTT